MATLSRESRKALERVVLAARGEAEAGARKALDQLAVAHHEPWSTMTVGEQQLRRRLRARGRQLGDRLEDRGKQGIAHLVAECAYEQWHRMLFARFLAECGLLVEPISGVPVSVEECKELSRERGVDWLSLASAFAQEMLPQIFRADDAVLEITLPAEHRQPIEQLLASLPGEVFLADDSLGWVYQFWQSEEKNRINESEKKIGPDELPAVTQLFTEDYMVEFLLHNTLGAWWCGRRFPDGVEANSEEQARAAVAMPGVEWKYLRFVEKEANRWLPAAGTFEGWPLSGRDLRVLDPCMGSGHFLVFAFSILVAIRQVDEHLSMAQACTSVLRNNVFGLEVDSRCTQIAAFNLALAAWKLGGWQSLPPLNVACSGLRLNAKRGDWVALAGTDSNARRGMEQLFDLFAQAPILGSLINPRKLGGDLLARGFHELQPLLSEALGQERSDEATHELAVTAHGAAKAAEILASQFTLVATNVPYLGRGKQASALKDYCDRVHAGAKADLATCFVERCLDFCGSAGTSALVTPQSWLFLGTFRSLRQRFLSTCELNLVVRLGPNAFRDMNWWAATTAMLALTHRNGRTAHHFVGLDVADVHDPGDKATDLVRRDVRVIDQAAQLHNPDARLGLNESSNLPLMATYADSFVGLQNGDTPRFVVKFWEVSPIDADWEFFQLTSDVTTYYGGRSGLLRWEHGDGELARAESAFIKGRDAWGKRGVAIRHMGNLPATLYLGEMYDQSSAVIVPRDQLHLPAVWAFCSSTEFSKAVRELDQALKVTNATLVKVPFDLSRWEGIAAEKYPDGLPKAHSDDPTQWLFTGDPHGATQPLHVAVARLLGYRWPRQMGSIFADCSAVDPDGLETYESEDGIVCISAIKGEETAEVRLRDLLAGAYGSSWGAAKIGELLEQVDYSGRTVDAWLREGFFEQHCEMFHQAPFLWHVWDGLKDGFGAILNYHKLTRSNLEKLTYAYLGDWIHRQEDSVAAGEAGSDARLVAAKRLQDELKKILQGEPPYDIFVRWKRLDRQPIGWEPDLNDGVRVNIRPFLMAVDVGKKGAGVLRTKPSIKWDKDRGKEASRSRDDFPWFWGWDEETKDFIGGVPFDGNRWNDLHYSREFKMAARARKVLS